MVLLMAALLLLQLVVATSACAPKRVMKGQAAPEPSKTQDIQKELPVSDVGDSEIPSPQPHGKIGQEYQGNPSENLLLGLKAATLAQEQLDKPYQWGGQGPENFDCSGLAYYVYGSLDISLPRVSRDQAKVGQKVSQGQLQPGDLVFFITKGKVINHVGIYIGKSRFIHAPRRYSPVRYDSLNNAWWRRRFQFGRRIQG